MTHIVDIDAADGMTYNRDAMAAELFGGIFGHANRGR